VNKCIFIHAAFSSYRPWRDNTTTCDMASDLRSCIATLNLLYLSALPTAVCLIIRENKSRIKLIQYDSTTTTTLQLQIQHYYSNMTVALNGRSTQLASV